MNTSPFPPILCLAIALAGCASSPALSPPDATDRMVTGSRSTGAWRETVPRATALAPARLADADTPAYVRVHPDKVGVTSAADDGYNTYIGLAAPATSDLRLFDADGRPLEYLSRGRLIGVAGTHRGILMRRGGADSFLAPSGLAGGAAGFDVDRDPDAVALRNDLAALHGQMDAFRQAVRNADAAMRAPDSRQNPIWTEPAVTRDPPAAPTVSAGPGWSGEPAVAPVQRAAAAAGSDGGDETWQRLPDGRILMRVFFASGGRAVVRPDDGLLRLEMQAQQADVIQVRGFTDSVGDPGRNDLLAQQRAEGVANFLVARGVPRERIIVESRGATGFLAENTSAQGRAMNRRVEVLFGFLGQRRS